MGPVLALEVGRQATSALAIVEVEAPQLIQKKLPSQKTKGKSVVVIASPRGGDEKPQSNSKPTIGYKIRSNSRAPPFSDASKKRKLALKAISESKKAKINSL